MTIPMPPGLQPGHCPTCGKVKIELLAKHDDGFHVFCCEDCGRVFSKYFDKDNKPVKDHQSRLF